MVDRQEIARNPAKIADFEQKTAILAQNRDIFVDTTSPKSLDFDEK